MSSNSKPRARSRRRELAVAVISVGVALLLWYLVFDARIGAPFDKFWIKMAIAAPILALISLTQFPFGALLGSVPAKRRAIWKTVRPAIIGIGSAAGLYLLFLLGNIALTSVFPATSASISSVYATGEGIPPWVVALLLLFVTSPSEEIFWRGFIQRVSTERWGRGAGVIITTALYTGVHVVTLNVPLVLAALTAGLVWALVYFSQKSIIPTIISHALWATTIFVILPVH